MNFSNKKKGNLQGIVVLGVVMFVMVIVLLVAGKLLQEVNTAFTNVDAIPAQGKRSVSILSTNWATIADSMFVLVFVLMIIVGFVSSFFIDSHPVFFVIAIPMIVVTLLVNAVLVNAIDDVGSTAPLVSIYSNMPMTLFLGSHWIAIMSMVAFGTFIVLVMKK